MGQRLGPSKSEIKMVKPGVVKEQPTRRWKQSLTKKDQLSMTNEVLSLLRDQTKNYSKSLNRSFRITEKHPR